MLAGALSPLRQKLYIVDTPSGLSTTHTPMSDFAAPVEETPPTKRQRLRNPLPDALLREIEEFRILLDDAVRRTSLRSTAREIPMSPTGLRGFLDGAVPYVKTVERIRGWVLRTSPTKHIPPNLLASALLSVTREVPVDKQPEARARLLATVKAIHVDIGLAPPPWLEAVARLMEAA